MRLNRFTGLQPSHLPQQPLNHKGTHLNPCRETFTVLSSSRGKMIWLEHLINELTCPILCIYVWKAYVNVIVLNQCCNMELFFPFFTVDPDFPCRPNRNGVYFPHPFVCNMYIWCVAGQQVIQRCPLGTLYRDEGQCTFDTDKNSHCYKNESVDPKE